MVVRLAGVEGVAGGERCGGRRFGGVRGFELRWFLVGLERWGGSARSRGREWGPWKGLGASVLAGFYRSTASAELAGDGEDDGLRSS